MESFHIFQCFLCGLGGSRCKTLCHVFLMLSMVFGVHYLSRQFLIDDTEGRFELRQAKSTGQARNTGGSF